jgi:hypothetical protein
MAGMRRGRITYVGVPLTPGGRNRDDGNLGSILLLHGDETSEMVQSLYGSIKAFRNPAGINGLQEKMHRPCWWMLVKGTYGGERLPIEAPRVKHYRFCWQAA